MTKTLKNGGKTGEKPVNKKNQLKIKLKKTN
jgi:hypothetical protein